MLLWVVASVLLAAAVVPWLYLGGKHFAGVVADDAGGVAGWLASGLSVCLSLSLCVCVCVSHSM